LPGKFLKMNLVIDQGNSRCKVAVYQQEEMLKCQILTRVDENSFIALLNEFPGIDACIFSSVRGENPGYIELLGKSVNLFLEMNHELRFPLKIAYQTPDTLGKDRLAGIVGAHTKFPKQNVLLIDAGSAITFDILTDQGVYLGGNISPGLEMRYRALHHFTGRLPLVKHEETDLDLGKSTNQAINIGVLQGMLYEIDGYITRWQKIHGNMKIILTGGDANFFEKNLKNGIFVDLNIVINGLNSILNFNVQE